LLIELSAPVPHTFTQNRPVVHQQTGDTACEPEDRANDRRARQKLGNGSHGRRRGEHAPNHRASSVRLQLCPRVFLREAVSGRQSHGSVAAGVSVARSKPGSGSRKRFPDVSRSPTLSSGGGKNFPSSRGGESQELGTGFTYQIQRATDQ